MARLRLEVTPFEVVRGQGEFLRKLENIDMYEGIFQGCREQYYTPGEILEFVSACIEHAGPLSVRGYLGEVLVWSWDWEGV